MRAFCAALVAHMALAGCASGPELPREVPIVISTPCIERAPVRPSLLSDTELAALDDFGLIVALGRDRRLRQAYEAELEAAIAGCQ